MALFLGYDPGGTGTHGVAQVEIDWDSGRVVRATSALTETADDALAYFVSATTPGRAAGLGVDTLTEWNLGPSGWRQADLWLRAKHPKVLNSIMAANSILGAMCVNGIGIIHGLRHQDPELVVSETHPKVLYFALAGHKYDWGSTTRPTMIAWLRRLLGQPSMDVPSSDEFDALLSAWACGQGVMGHWTHDLHVPVAGTQAPGTVIRPAGPTHFYWP